ncbi:TonB-dependent receptor [Pseudomaricurvus alkylphenolicus]|jgi:iron complex outermembrane receptor protein|uniref:TonB-dependent receptor domain-containing protein n=1 Tax=Pseudomaricurvus alkylphenolicus TaxID=1306991 RepID=UPI00141EDD2E|nr:TonB-dependent receptor [Pseudomaricurvus alkylphenolicus]NIB40918.1 TonB-dependent receptor [Pseudomaricurvus alkylphenolicus]
MHPTLHRLRSPLFAALLGLSSSLVVAQPDIQETVIQIDLPAQPLDAALLQLSEQADTNIFGISEQLTRFTSPAISGELGLHQAMEQLLDGTGLRFRITPDLGITILPPVEKKAHKQEPERRQPRIIEEIVVTSTRRSTDLQDTPIAVTAISQTMLDRHQAKDIRDVTDIVPSLEMTNTGVQSALLVQLRGIGQTNITEIADGPVAFHVDGIYSPRAQGAAALLYDVDRVEVLRGPQGTLYGRNATSGSINILTRRPQFDEFNAHTSVSMGNFQRRAARGMLNLPISETLAVRAAVAFDQHDPYADLVTDYAGLGPQYPTDDADLSVYQQATADARAPYAEDQYSRRLSLQWQPHERLTAFISAERYTDRGTSVTELDPSLVEKGHWITVSDTPGFIDLTNDVIRSRVDYTFANDLTLSYMLGTAKMTREQAFDVDRGRSGNYEQRRTVSSTFKVHSHELQLVNSDSEQLRWIVGAFYSREKNDIVFTIDQADNDGGGDLTNTTSYISDDPGAGVAFFVQPDRQVEAKAFYAQGTYDLNASSRLTGGVRFTEDTKSDNRGRSLNCRVTAVGPYLEPGSIGPGAPSPDQIYADPGAQAAIDAGQPYDNGTSEGIGDEACWVRQVNDYSATWRNTSGLLRYEYDVDEDIMLYASATTGFKSGHIQDRGNEADPEEVINYELGLKSKLLNGHMRLNAALFSAHYKDLQFSDRDHFDNDGDGIVDRVTSTIVRNAAKARVNGLEVEMDWAISDVDFVQMAVSLMDAEFDNFQTPDTLFGNLFNDYAAGDEAAQQDIVDLSGNAPVRTPDWKLTLIYEHDFQVAAGILTSRLKATFSDQYFLDIYNRDKLAPGVFDSAPDGVNGLAVQDAYQTYDLSLFYSPDKGSWSVEAFVNNLTDEAIKTSSGTFITPEGFDAIYQPPRTYGLTLSYQFK